MAQIVIFTGNTLIDPTKFKDPDAAIFPVLRSIGAYQIARRLENHDYSVQVVDFFPYIVAKDFQLILKILDKYVDQDTIWIGFSSTLFDPVSPTDTQKEEFRDSTVVMNEDQMQEFKNKVLGRNPKCKIVMGGAKAGVKFDNTFIDYYVEGYADDSAIELTKYLENKNPFLQFTSNPNGTRNLISDRTASRFDFKNYRFSWQDHDHIFQDESLPIEIGRGCIFKCSYCTYPLNGRKKLDYIKDPQILYEEFVRNYEKWNITDYMYSDDTHNEAPEKIEILFDKVYSRLPFKINFRTYLRLDLLRAHKHTIDILKESGIVSCFFGIESFNYESAKSVGKGERPEKTLEMLYLLKEKWPDVFKQSGFIIGLPHEDEASARRWLDMISTPEFPVDTMFINPLHIFKPKDQDETRRNEIDLNPAGFGYEFLDDINWVNNKGMTKDKAWEIRNEYMKKLWQAGKNRRTWITTSRLKSIGLTIEEYDTLTFDQKMQKRNSRLDQYIERLL
jgi:radical SAM superfamily enzyme YgiQ (UPF0313 family)